MYNEEILKPIFVFRECQECMSDYILLEHFFMSENISKVGHIMKGFFTRRMFFFTPRFPLRI